VASGNRLFHVVFQALDEPIRMLIKNRLRSSQGPSREQTLAQHEELLDAIRDGEPQRAAVAARSHLCGFYVPGLPPQERARIQSFVKAMHGSD